MHVYMLFVSSSKLRRDLTFVFFKESGASKQASSEEQSPKLVSYSLSAAQGPTPNPLDDLRAVTVQFITPYVTCS
ncbi:hypothetical protein BKA67DRAFT_379219 [Truncatella angustata]|uniref:Uncharacterized protein n=1 Tax=Truncatella angustata TaxID=152316 RepID=A0A9P8UFG5_9PEZI|nr:uncharacterized protein BKA67DRAFT_379219 [Truncatella angustata]KAH6649006.1 hypothetical protein BKA67DRAFT_379219 [Truncatella angustata]